MSWGGMYYGRNSSPVSCCFVCIPADQIAVFEFCQKFKGILKPGFHCVGLNCCGLCVTVRAVSTRVEENLCVCETKTKDNVFVNITVAVQQQPNLTNVRDAIYKLMNPNQQVSSYVSDVVRAEVPKMTLDEVFENKDAIAVAVANKITIAMEKFGYNILQALVTNVQPDQNVKRALNAVEAANKDRIARETQAKAAHYVAVKKAEAESESKALQGQGIAKQRAAIVDGLRESIGFQPGAASSKQVSELLLVTQYFDTLEKISEGRSKCIFVPTTEGAVDPASQLRDGMLQAEAARL